MMKTIQVQVNKKSSSHSPPQSSPKQSPRGGSSDRPLAVLGQNLEYPTIVISPRNQDCSPPNSARKQARPGGPAGAQPPQQPRHGGPGGALPTRQISAQLSLDSVEQLAPHHYPVFDDSPRSPTEKHAPFFSEEAETTLQQQHEKSPPERPQTTPRTLTFDDRIFDDPAHLNEIRLAAMLSRQKAKESIYHHGQQPQQPQEDQQMGEIPRPEEAEKRKVKRIIQRPQSGSRRFHFDQNEERKEFTPLHIEPGIITKPLEIAGRQSRPTTGSRSRPRSQGKGSNLANNHLHNHGTRVNDHSPRDTESLQQLLFESLQEYYKVHEASMIHGETSSVLPDVYAKGEVIGGSFDVNNTKPHIIPATQDDPNNNPTTNFNLAAMVKEMLAAPSMEVNQAHGSIPTKPDRPKSSNATTGKSRNFIDQNKQVNKRPQSAVYTKNKLLQSFQKNQLHYLGERINMTPSDVVFGSVDSTALVEPSAAPVLTNANANANANANGGANMSPGIAVMLLAHDILQKQPKPKFRPIPPSEIHNSNIPINILLPDAKTRDYQHLQRVVNRVQKVENIQKSKLSSSDQNNNPFILPDDLKKQMNKQLKMYKHLNFGEQLSTLRNLEQNIDDETQAQLDHDDEEGNPTIATPTILSPRTAIALKEALQVVEDNTQANGNLQADFQQRLLALREKYRREFAETNDSHDQHDVDDDHGLIVEEEHESIYEMKNTTEAAIPLLPPQSPNSSFTKEEIDEITLRWKKFLSHPQTMPIGTNHQSKPPTKKVVANLMEAPTLFHNTESLMDLSAPNTARSKPEVTPHDSILPPSMELQVNPYAIDNYDPQHLLYSPELLYNAYIENGGLLNTANYRHPSSIPTNHPAPQVAFTAPTPDGRPVSRGNYLYSFYEQQQQKLKKQYEGNNNHSNNNKPQSDKKEGELVVGSFPAAEDSTQPKGKVILTLNADKDKAQRKEKPEALRPISPNASKPSSPSQKQRKVPPLNDIKGQNEVVRINHNIPSARIPSSRQGAQPDHRYGSVHINSFDEQEGTGNQKNYADSFLSLESNAVLPMIVDPNSSKNKNRPSSPHITNRKGDAMKRNQSLEEIIVQPNSIAFFDKKQSHPAHTTRQSAVRYAKYVEGRNKELNKVGWSNQKLKESNSKSPNVLPLMLDVQSPPPPVLTIVYNGSSIIQQQNSAVDESNNNSRTS